MTYRTWQEQGWTLKTCKHCSRKMCVYANGLMARHLDREGKPCYGGGRRQYS